MGKKSERQAGSSQFGDAGVVAETAGAVSGIGVTEGAEALVIAADEPGAGADAARNFHDAAVEPKAEFSHGLGLVEILFAKQVAGQPAKNFLPGVENGLVAFTAGRDIEASQKGGVWNHPA